MQIQSIVMIRGQKLVILSETKWSRRILAGQPDRRRLFSFPAKPRSFDSALRAPLRMTDSFVRNIAKELLQNATVPLSFYFSLQLSKRWMIAAACARVA